MQIGTNKSFLYVYSVFFSLSCVHSIQFWTVTNSFNSIKWHVVYSQHFHVGDMSYEISINAISCGCSGKKEKNSFNLSMLPTVVCHILVYYNRTVCVRKWRKIYHWKRIMKCAASWTYIYIHIQINKNDYYDDVCCSNFSFSTSICLNNNLISCHFCGALPGKKELVLLNIQYALDNATTRT